MWARKEQVREMKMGFLLRDFQICIAGVSNEIREKSHSELAKERKWLANWQVREKLDNWDKQIVNWASFFVRISEEGKQKEDVAGTSNPLPVSNNDEDEANLSKKEGVKLEDGKNRNWAERSKGRMLDYYLRLTNQMVNLVESEQRSANVSERWFEEIRQLKDHILNLESRPPTRYVDTHQILEEISRLQVAEMAKLEGELSTLREANEALQDSMLVKVEDCNNLQQREAQQNVQEDKQKTVWLDLNSRLEKVILTILWIRWQVLKVRNFSDNRLSSI
ncbi:hypothetical protein R1flu_019908 [Riccia fluitans]|uniref:Uncharacterized protein n=1 Tax=Riccia fluitans TaxID=41844 RepID=A0ABD1ZK02_9MARC